MKLFFRIVAVLVALAPAACGCSDPAEVPIPGDDLLGSRSYWRNIHANGMNTDEVPIAIAPKYRPGWVAEDDMMIVSGVVFDQRGNLYFSPMLPKERVMLVSLEPRKGDRRWALRGTGYGAGSPMVLDDPEDRSRQVIYLGLYSEAMAVNQDGDILWRSPTGLTEPEEGLFPLCFGVNYHPQSDAILGLTVDGRLYALDRKSGEAILDAPYSLPGGMSPSRQDPSPILTKLLMRRYLKQLKPFFSREMNQEHIMALLDVMEGKHVEVANFFAVDPNRGRIWIVATAPDDADGKADGISEKGALYGLDLVPSRTGLSPYEVREGCRGILDGPSGTTPSLRSDGKRIYIGGGGGSLLAFSDECQPLWQIELPSVDSSVSVSSDDDGIYVQSDTYIKVMDRGLFAEVAWVAPLDERIGPTGKGKALIGPALGANGVYVQIAGGPSVMIDQIGLGVLNRGTGALDSFKEAFDETSAVICIGPGGGAYIPHSPFRRAILRSVFQGLPPLMGGVGEFEPIRLDLLIRDAACAAKTRADKACAVATASPSAAESQVRRIDPLIEQCEDASGKAVRRGDIRRSQWDEVSEYLASARTNLIGWDFCSAAANLGEACSRLAGR